jgi:hypothetical protein
VSAGTLHFRLFTTGGIVSRTGGLTTIRLAVPLEQRAWWRALFEKLVSRYPNGNAVAACICTNESTPSLKLCLVHLLLNRYG